jgi:hypothetical protein
MEIIIPQKFLYPEIAGIVAVTEKRGYGVLIGKRQLVISSAGHIVQMVPDPPEV